MRTIEKSSGILQIWPLIFRFCCILDSSGISAMVRICTVFCDSLLALVSELKPVLMYRKAREKVGTKRDGCTMQTSLIFTALDFIIFLFSIGYICAAVTCLLAGRLPWALEHRGRQRAAYSQQAYRPAPTASPLCAGKVAGLQPGEPRQVSIEAEVSSLSPAVT